MKAGSCWFFLVPLLIQITLIITENKKLLKNKFFHFAIYLPALVFSLLFLFTDLIAVESKKTLWGYTSAFVLPSDPTTFYIFNIWGFSATFWIIFLFYRYFKQTATEEKKHQIRFLYRSIGGIIFLRLIEVLLDMFFARSGIEIPEFLTLYMTLFAVFFSYAIWKYKLFLVDPSTAADNIVDTMNDGLILLDTKGRILNVNKAFSKLTGFTRNEVYQEPLEILFKDCDQKEFALNHIKNKKEINNVTLNFDSKHGDLIFFNFSSSILYDNKKKAAGFVCILNDITELKHSHEELKKQRDWLDVTLTSIGDCVIATDKKSKITFINSSAEALTGWNRQAAIGKDIGMVFNIIHELTREKIESPVEKVLKEGTLTGFANHSLLISKNGKEIPIGESGSPIKSDNGEILGVILVFRDLTERRNADTKLQQMHSQLVQSEKIASIGQLAAGVAHEINNPVGYISSNLSAFKKNIQNIFLAFASLEETALICCSDDADKLEKFQAEIASVKKINNFEFIKNDLPNLLLESIDGTARIQKIVANLLEFARPAKEEFQQSAINKIIEKSLALVWNELKYKCEIKKEYGNRLPVIICNEGQLIQVFVNLFMNAAQAIENKNGLIAIKTYFEKPLVCVEISDNGKGIEGKHLDKIFEPFFTTKEVGKGTGLGLSIVYGIIQNHKGTIEVKSKPGEGSVFIIKFPE